MTAVTIADAGTVKPRLNAWSDSVTSVGARLFVYVLELSSALMRSVNFHASSPGEPDPVVPGKSGPSQLPTPDVDDEDDENCAAVDEDEDEDSEDVDCPTVDEDDCDEGDEVDWPTVDEDELDHCNCVDADDCDEVDIAAVDESLDVDIAAVEESDDVL